MSITAQQLLQILPNAGAKAAVFAPVLNTAMGKYQIITKARIAAFIAQIGHESGHLRYVRELDGTAYLAKYDTGGWPNAWAIRPRLTATASSTAGAA